MAEWRIGRMAECGTVEWWKWRNGGMVEWRNGGMVEWRNGGMAGIATYLPHLWYTPTTTPTHLNHL
jgi:hypothetical protein